VQESGLTVNTIAHQRRPSGRRFIAEVIGGAGGHAFFKRQLLAGSARLVSAKIINHLTETVGKVPPLSGFI
jgi:hypothetical protein